MTSLCVYILVIIMANEWIKVDIYTSSEGVEVLCSALSNLGHDSVSVVDSADLEKLMDGKYGAWDYIDPELMKLGEVETCITLYSKCQPQNHLQNIGSINAIKQMLERLKKNDIVGELGRLECRISHVNDKNWADSWKENYDPIIIGEKLAVCPTWMDCTSDNRLTGRKIMSIDPGMAFGTGLDVTTRLCLEALESMDVNERSVLDIGCGSGILAIGALLLGARSALGVDIDDMAVKTAKENAGLNGVSCQSEFVCVNLNAGEHSSPLRYASERSSLLRLEFAPGTYDIVCANISTDVILSLMPELPGLLKLNGILILSGIIKDRELEITNSLINVGRSIEDCKNGNGWSCIVAKS